MSTEIQELQKIVSITTRNNIKLIPLTCAYAQQLALGIGMSDERANAISEVIRVVLTRRMTYAYQGIGEITLDILVGLDRLELEIADKGLPYWIDLEQELKQYPKGADQYRLKKLGREGQRFSMCFYLDPGIDILSFKKQDDVAETLLDDALTVRRASAGDEDINQVMQCIYSNYGYEYPNPVIYEPAQMKGLLSEGRQWSYLGCNDHGQVLAHGTPGEVMNEELIKALYGIDAEVVPLRDGRMRVCIPRDLPTFSPCEQVEYNSVFSNQ